MGEAGASIPTIEGGARALELVVAVRQGGLLARIGQDGQKVEVDLAGRGNAFKPRLGKAVLG